MIINRVGQPPFEIKRGLEVDVFISKEHKYKGIITGISNAKQTVKVNGLEYDKGRIYPSGYLIPNIELKPKKAVALSNAIIKINKQNTPPGGWDESCKVC